VIAKGSILIAAVIIFSAVTVVAIGWAIREGCKKRIVRAAQFVYLGCSSCAVTFWIAFCDHSAIAAKIDILRAGPISDLGITLICVVLAWGLFGGILLILNRRALTPEQWFYWIAFFLFAFLYVNVLRERTHYGDVADFAAAAGNLARHQHMHIRYLYPPLFATILQPLVPYGVRYIMLACFVVNYGSLLCFFMLLHRALMRYGFSSPASTCLICLALFANVPIIRTLFYVQTNFHVANLIILSLLLYPRYRIPSAVALALAAHIKTSPLLLVLPFIVNRDWKWLSSYAFTIGSVVLATSYINGFTPYLDYFTNITYIYRANGISYRDNSIDSLFRATVFLMGAKPGIANAMIFIVRSMIAFLGLLLCYFVVKYRVFDDSTSVIIARVYNAYPILLLLMVTLSPLLWEHHPVLFVLSILVMLKIIQGKTEMMLFLVAYFFIFLLPTFDLYPFSYHILLGIMICYWLIFRRCRRVKHEACYFTQMNRIFDEIPALFKIRPTTLST
jgi:hypothetical protein